MPKILFRLTNGASTWIPRVTRIDHGSGWTEITWSDKTVIWYADASAFGQLNASGLIYDYVAFG